MGKRKRGCPACGKSHTYDEPCDFRGHPRGRFAAPVPAPVPAPVWGGHVCSQGQRGSVVGGENPAPMAGPLDEVARLSAILVRVAAVMRDCGLEGLRP